MLAPVIDVLAITGEADSDSIETRLDKARNEELRHKCALSSNEVATKA